MCPKKPFNKVIVRELISLWNSLQLYVDKLSAPLEQGVFSVKACCGISNIVPAIADLASRSQKLVVICPFIDLEILVCTIIPSMILHSSWPYRRLAIATHKETYNMLKNKLDMFWSGNSATVNHGGTQLTIDIDVQERLHAKVIAGYTNGKVVGLVKTTANFTKRSLYQDYEVGTYYRDPSLAPEQKLWFVENLLS